MTWIETTKAFEVNVPTLTNKHFVMVILIKVVLCLALITCIYQSLNPYNSKTKHEPVIKNVDFH